MGVHLPLVKHSLSPITVPLSGLYRAAIHRRNNRFDQGIGVERIEHPVISIGNVTVGGTGKTPMVAWVVETLQEAGCRPLIAMRGYRAEPNGVSDEEAEYRDRLPGVPVVAAPDRVDALRRFLSEDGVRDHDCVVLDDGFQHRKLHRDLDLALIDATQRTFAERLLPAGRLREPIRNLARADAVIVTRARSVDAGLEFEIKKAHGHPPLAWAAHAWTSLELYGPVRQTVPVEWLAGKRAVAMFGVGNARAVEDQVHEAGAMIRRRIPVRDHQHYREKMLPPVYEACNHPQIDALIVTPKDWVKLRDVTNWKSWPTPVVVPRLEISFLDGGERLRERLLQCIKRFDPGDAKSSGDGLLRD